MATHFQTVVASIEWPDDPRELIEASRLVEPDGRVHVLHTLPPHSGDLRAALDELRSTVAGHTGGASLSLHVRRGHRAEETARLAAECEADLVVYGAFKPASADAAGKVLAWVACSVLIVAPSREHSQVDALAPKFSVCQACADARARNRGQWFCANHEKPDQHLYEALDQT